MCIRDRAYPVSVANPSSASLQIGGAELQIDITGVDADLSKPFLIAKISKSAEAVAAYYGRFPVSSARIVVVVTAGGHGVLRGTTWGRRDGYPAVTRLIVGQHTTPQEFDTDWIVTVSYTHLDVYKRQTSSRSVKIVLRRSRWANSSTVHTSGSH